MGEGVDEGDPAASFGIAVEVAEGGHGVGFVGDLDP